MYGDGEALRGCNDSMLLFQVFGLALKYMVIKEIFDLIKRQMEDFDVSPKTVGSALETIVFFKDLEGFENVTKVFIGKVIEKRSIEKVMPALQAIGRFENKETLAAELMEKIVEKFKERFPDDPTEYYLEHIDENPKEIRALMVAVSPYKPPKCSNCLEPLNKCRDGDRLVAKPHTGLRCTATKNGQANDVLVFETVEDNGNGAEFAVTWKINHEIIRHNQFPKNFTRAWRYKCKN